MSTPNRASSPAHAEAPARRGPPIETGYRLATLPRRPYRDRPAHEIRFTLDEFPPGSPLVRIQSWTINRAGEAWPDRDRQITVLGHEIADVAAALAKALEMVAAQKTGGAR